MENDIIIHKMDDMVQTKDVVIAVLRRKTVSQGSR